MASKYKIKIKRDFGAGKGHWMPNAGTHGAGNYGFVRSGFVVTKDGANVIPGAGWFRTIEDAMCGIRAHMVAGEGPGFHDVYKDLKAAQ